MNSKPSQHWQDWILLFIGAWLFVAPWSLATTSDANSSWNAWTLSILVLATAWWALAKPADKTPGWFQGFYGVWLFATPWVLGFSGISNAAWNAWLVGGAIITVACWEVIEEALAGDVQIGSKPDHLAHGPL